MLLWADGFGQYGNSGRMVASGFYTYTTNSGSEPLRIGSGAYARTGNYYWDASGILFNNWYGGVFFGGSRDTVGCGAAFLFNTLPDDDGWCPFMFCGDTKDVFQVSVRVNPNGSLSVASGKDGSVLGTSSAGVITAGAYAYIQMKVFAHASTGTVEVRVNNVPRLVLSGLNTAPLGYARLGGIMAGRRNLVTFTAWCNAISDFVIWDTTTAKANDFLGDRRCYTQFGNANGPLQDWVATGSPAYGEIDNVPYDAAKNIAAAVVGDISNFAHEALPETVAQIAGVNIFVIANKTDTGTCEITPQILSGVDVADGNPISPGTGIAAYNSLIAVDPATSDYFTRTGWDATLLQAERTA